MIDLTQGEKPADFVEIAIDDVPHFAHVNTGTLYKDGRAVNSPYLQMLNQLTTAEAAKLRKTQCTT